ncbi:MAG TPA: transcription antitermination factor NusB, partial [Porphyromonadaceae bacterium]|nr:transcription antitermination factor NusB [Porphyromonadaceae bacterium]
VYAWYQNTNKDLRTAEKELLFGLQKSYDLYYYLLLLMVELTKAYDARVEAKRNKYLPTDEDLNPNTRLIENKFIGQLSQNHQFNKYLNERPMSWREHDAFVKNLLDEIIASDIYAEYANETKTDYNDDREFWRKIFKQFILDNEKLEEILEDESIFWNDDIEIVQTFVMKSIRQFSEENGENQRLLPMFKDDEDRQFALKLLHDTILNEQKYRQLIETHSEKWAFDRIAFLEMIIMQIALAEIHT